MNDPSFQTNLIKKIETELQHTIIDASSPPQGMGSTVFLIKTDDKMQYAVKYGSTVTNDIGMRIYCKAEYKYSCTENMWTLYL